MSLRNLQRRVKRLEQDRKPRPSPFTVLYGSFDAWVEREVLPGIESGALDARDMIAVVAALRKWEDGELWVLAYAR
jgi:hypothetical protein